MDGAWWMDLTATGHGGSCRKTRALQCFVGTQPGVAGRGSGIENQNGRECVSCVSVVCLKALLLTKTELRCSCRPEVYTNRSVEPRPWAFLDPQTGDPGCKEAGASPRPWADAVERVPSCPDFGMTCFNNFAVAFLTCFKIVTLDNWSHVMWWAQDTLHPWARLYFLSLVFLVSFNIVNLYVAGISASYQSVREARLKRTRLRNIRKQHASSMHESRPSSFKSNKEQDNEEADTQPLEDQEDVSSKANMIHFFQPARKRLCRVSHACRRLVTYPQIIDECGQRVDGYLLTLAAERKLKVTFGPNMGQWQILPENVVVFDENSLEPNLVRQSTQPV